MLYNVPGRAWFLAGAFVSLQRCFDSVTCGMKKAPLFTPAKADTLGPNRRLVFTVPSVDSTEYPQVVVKLILPAELMVTLAYMAAGADRDTISPDLIALELGRAN